MIVVCSGEGVSDLGGCSNQLGVCAGGDFRLGPLSVVIDSVIEECLGYSPKEICPDIYRYYSESALTHRAEERKSQRRGFALAGRKHGLENGFFYINAWMLGEIAKDLEEQEKDAAVAVLFRDSDGTNSSPRDLWARKVMSMKEGFIRADFSRGIPMVPRPKSEAWFLCAVKQNPYQHCGALEDLPGNDNSPNSAKQELSRSLGAGSTAEELLVWIEKNGINRVLLSEQMPSFSSFYERAKTVLESLRG